MYPIQSESQIELVILIRSNSECELPLIVGFEELGKLGVLCLGHFLEVGLGSMDVLGQNGGLEIYKRELEGEGDYIEGLVD